MNTRLLPSAVSPHLLFTLPHFLYFMPCPWIQPSWLMEGKACWLPETTSLIRFHTDTTPCVLHSYCHAVKVQYKGNIKHKPFSFYCKKKISIYPTTKKYFKKTFTSTKHKMNTTVIFKYVCFSVVKRLTLTLKLPTNRFLLINFI